MASRWSDIFEREPAEPSTWPGAVISGVRALALAPYLEPRGVYFILVLSTGEAENESCLEEKNIDAGCSSCAPGCCRARR